MIELGDIVVSFDGNVILDGVSLTIERGEVVALLGASGSGKSTILRVVAGLLAPDAGTVRIDGVDVTGVPTHRRGVGMVFQDNQLFPHRTVAENVAFGLKMAGIGATQRRELASDWLRRVGLAGFGPRTTTELSGGEAKRVALARTLVVEPRVVLLDEPLTGLDRELRDDLLADLSALLRATEATALLVTHDVDEARACADRVVHMHELTGAARPSTPLEVRLIEPSATHDLRRRVLRDGDTEAEVAWADDENATTWHLGAFDDDRLVGVATWIGRDDGVQLRGMAVDPDAARSGIGSALLGHGLDACRSRGYDRVWANARVTALGFYARAGFDVVGEEFATSDTGLPHRRIERALG